jgi:choice-of-anchor C domain-containing protein
MKGTVSLGIILVLLLASIGVASAAIVQNGGFETSGVVPQPPGYLTCPDGILNDWTLGGTIDVINGYWIPFEGSQSIDLTGSSPGSISQTLTLDPTKTYQISFAMAANPGGLPEIKTVRVHWDNQVFDFSFDKSAHPGLSLTNMQWETKTINGLTSSGSTVLAFEDITADNTYYGVALDDVIVVEEDNSPPTPVPEFPTIALPMALIIGILGAVLFIQRTKEN